MLSPTMAYWIQLHASSKPALLLLGTLTVVLVSLLSPVRITLARTLLRPPRSSAVAAVFVFIFALVGRLVLALIEPFALPGAHDEYSYLLAADTFAHGRLSNPTPLFWTHFETYHELFVPAYASKYPPGQGLLLALGQVVFHQPMVAVILSCALLSACLYWGLCAIVPRRWAWLGSLVAAVQICWMSYWSNSYWGGALAAIGGCLLVGGAIRFARSRRLRDAILLSIGVVILANTRPYEGLLLTASVFAWLVLRLVRAPAPRPPLLAPIVAFVLIGAMAGGAMAWYNLRVTGYATRLPASEACRQCGITPLFWVLPLNHKPLCLWSTQKNQPDLFELPEYRQAHSLRGFLHLTATHLKVIRAFFLGPAGLLAPVGLILCWRVRRVRWLFGLFVLMFVGWSLETWTHPHYYAPATIVICALEVYGLRGLACCLRSRRIGRLPRPGECVVFASVLFLALAFLVRCGQGVVAAQSGHPTRPLNETADSKLAVEGVLANMGGSHLVLIRYALPHNPIREWVYNSADIASQPIIWAHSLDPEDPDAPLICYYRNRHVWRLTPPETGAWTPQQARSALQPIDTNLICRPGER